MIVSTQSHFYRAIGRRLFDTRESLGISRIKAAQQSDMTHDQLREVEIGIRKASEKQLIKLSSLYNKPLVYFVRSLEPDTS